MKTTSEVKDFIKKSESEILKLKDEYVLCAFSGGVDSLVSAYLTSSILKDHLYCFFIDHGLLRPQDLTNIDFLKKNTDLNIEYVDAKDQFLTNLKGHSDPEEKRKIIGKTFIEVFDKKVQEFEKNHQIKFTYLLQGTIYPDILESESKVVDGKLVAPIKSHHNVGGLPERMNLLLLEPLKTLYKNEVRLVGKELGLSSKLVNRHPFPGPGIGVRILGEITKDAIVAVQKSDQILFEELHNQNLYDKFFQAFTVYLPVKSVGIKNQKRVFENVISLRIIESLDAMSANWSHLPYEFLDCVSKRITSEVPGITRVVYDITSKPPATIEWE